MESKASLARSNALVAIVRKRCPAHETPTQTQLEVLRAVLVHGTCKAAADALFKTEYVVEWHIGKLRKMAGVHHLHQLIARAIVLGWLTEDDLSSSFGPKGR